MIGRTEKEAALLHAELWSAFSPKREMMAGSLPPLVWAGRTVEYVEKWTEYGTALDRAEAPHRRAIVKAEWILDLEPGWDDGEGSPFAKETLEKVRDFLLHHCRLSFEAGLRGLPTPDIDPADKGSIDLHWRLPDRTLLVNIKPEDQPTAFFGSDSDGNTIGGVSQRPRLDLMVWLLDHV